MKLYDRKEWMETQPQDKGNSNCPFCENTSIDVYCIWQGKNWKILHNKYPLLGLDTHIMLIPKDHIILAKDIPVEALKELPEAYTFIHNFFGGKKYFSYMRESRDCRSLEHLHYHYVPGNIYYESLEEMLKKQGF